MFYFWRCIIWTFTFWSTIDLESFFCVVWGGDQIIFFSKFIHLPQQHLLKRTLGRLSKDFLLMAGRGGSSLWPRHFGRSRWVDHKVKRSRPSWSTRWNPVSTKNTKISWAWWCAPVVPATREAEAGELFEPRRWRLRWAEIVPLHSSLAPGNRARLCLKKKKKIDVV